MTDIVVTKADGECLLFCLPDDHWHVSSGCVCYIRPDNMTPGQAEQYLREQLPT